MKRKNMASFAVKGDGAALAAERRALAAERDAAQRAVEREQRRSRGADALNERRQLPPSKAEAAAAAEQALLASKMRRNNQSARELQLKARERVRQRRVEEAEAAAAAEASRQVQQVAASYSQRLSQALLEYAQIDPPRRPASSPPGPVAWADAADAASDSARPRCICHGRSAERRGSVAPRSSAPQVDSMVVEPASQCRDPARVGASAPGVRISSLPRWPARPASARQDEAATVLCETALRRAERAVGAEAARPAGSMIVHPASMVRDPAKGGNGFLGLAAPGGLGHAAPGTKFSHVKRFADDAPLAGPTARGGDVAADEMVTRLLLPGDGVELVECCGDPYDGYCCRRHHPDDAVVCCPRHAGTGEESEQQPVKGRAEVFSRTPRDTAMPGAPPQHRRAPRRVRPPRRVSDGRPMQVPE